MAVTGEPDGLNTSLDGQRRLNRMESFKNSISEIADIMTKNILQATMRGENLDNLREKSQLLAEKSKDFDKITGRIYKEEKAKYRKKKLALIGVAALALVIIILLLVLFLM